jgi:hypothetical protein
VVVTLLVLAGLAAAFVVLVARAVLRDGRPTRVRTTLGRTNPMTSSSRTGGNNVNGGSSGGNR